MNRAYHFEKPALPKIFQNGVTITRPYSKAAIPSGQLKNLMPYLAASPSSWMHRQQQYFVGL